MFVKQNKIWSLLLVICHATHDFEPKLTHTHPTYVLDRNSIMFHDGFK